MKGGLLLHYLDWIREGDQVIGRVHQVQKGGSRYMDHFGVIVSEIK